MITNRSRIRRKPKVHRYVLGNPVIKLNSTKRKTSNNNSNNHVQDNASEPDPVHYEEIPRTLDNSFQLSPAQLYFNALNRNIDTALYLSSDRWILIRSHQTNKPDKLSYSHYWIINCSDPEMRSLHCSCKSFQCIHICYVKSNLQNIQFPLPPLQMQQQHNNSSAVADNEVGERYCIEVVREMPDNHLMRRILLVSCKIDLTSIYAGGFRRI